MKTRLNWTVLKECHYSHFLNISDNSSQVSEPKLVLLLSQVTQKNMISLSEMNVFVLCFVLFFSEKFEKIQ